MKKTTHPNTVAQAAIWVMIVSSSVLLAEPRAWGVGRDVGAMQLVASLPLLGAAATTATVPPFLPVEIATVVRSIETSALVPAVIDPAGIAYLEHSDRLLIADSEIDEEPSVFAGLNLVEMTRLGAPEASGLSPDFPLEPSGLTYDPLTRHIFIANDVSNRIYEVGHGLDGIYGTADDSSRSFDGAAFGLTDAEDVAFDTRSGDLFILDGDGKEVFRVNPGANGIFDGVAPAGDDGVASVDLSGIGGALNLEGLGYREVSDTLLVVDAGVDDSIYEMTKDGFVLRRIDLDEITLVGVAEVPSDVVVAPASSGSGQDHLYIVDRNSDNGDPGDGQPPPLDGRVYELTTPFADLPPYVDAGGDMAIVLSATAQLKGLAVDDGQPVLGAMRSTWTRVSGPGDVSFSDPNSPVTQATFNAVGTYVLQLAGDDSATRRTDTVQVVVGPDPTDNTPPVVDAGFGGTYLQRERPVLSGFATDDGLPNPPRTVTVRWEKVSGPGSVVFASPDNPVTSVAFGTIGVYVLRLTATDGELSAFDDVTITVLPNVTGWLKCTDDAFSGAPFLDIGGLSPEARDAIHCLFLFGITEGTSPTTYSPFEQVERWQMALFLIRQADVQGVVLPDGSDQGFVDIGGYAQDVQKAINQLAQLGLTVGTGPGRFSPDQGVSRWQMALFLSRLLEDVGVSLPPATDQGYSDIGGLPPTTQEAINQITQLTVAKGVAPQLFDPESPVQRWQMALFLARTLDVGRVP